MDISSITVSMGGGDNYVIPMQEGGSHQQSIKDMLLEHLLKKTHSQGLQDKIVEVFKAPENKPLSEIPLINKCSYTGGFLTRGSKQMDVRNHVVERFNEYGNAFALRKDLIEYAFGLVQGIKINSVENYIGGMIAAGILEKHERDSSLVRLSQNFTNQTEGK